MAILALLNFAGVLSLKYGTIDWVRYPIVFATLTLFIEGLSNPKPKSTKGLRMVGGLFNFIGVVSGVVGDNPDLLIMAIVGSILLISAHFGGLNSPEDN